MSGFFGEGRDRLLRVVLRGMAIGAILAWAYRPEATETAGSPLTWHVLMKPTLYGKADRSAMTPPADADASADVTLDGLE